MCESFYIIIIISMSQLFFFLYLTIKNKNIDGIASWENIVAVVFK